VTKSAAEEQKKSAAPTQSPGSATRPSGMRSLSQARVFGFFSQCAPILVRTTVGAMPFTQMPRCPSSAACWRMSITSPPLVAQ
jgi:hypothetical protein